MKGGFFIPDEYWKDKSLTIQEKILMAEIASFTKNGKDCFLSNESIGELLGVGPWRASIIVSSLIRKQRVRVAGFDGKKRYLALCKTQSQPLAKPKGRHCEKPKAAFSKTQSQPLAKPKDTIPTDTTYHSVAIIDKNYNNDAKDFVPPTVAQVYDYVKDKGMKDPMGFAYYYVKTQTANGWTRRQGNKLVPVLNWKNNVNQWMPNHMNHVFPKPEIQQTPTFAERVYGPSDLSEITTLVPLDVEKHIRAGGWARFTNNTWTKI